MITNLTTTTAATIRSSLPLMESKREHLEAAMSRYLSRAGPYDPSKGRNRVTAGAIMDMLFDHAGRVSGGDAIVLIDRHGARHRQLAIGGEHYSSFGDGLGAVMKDVLGSDATPARLAAWGDTYWAIARMVAATPASLAA